MMIRRTFTSVAILAGLAAVAAAVSPGLRTAVFSHWAAVGGWTEAARRAEPVAFARYAEKKLRQDLQTMEKTRRDLAAEVGQIARKLRTDEALSEQAITMAEDFRSEFQLASTSGRFPIEVRGAAYTEDQARSQVSMLLAESEGYQQSLADLRKVKQQAEAQMESLAVKITASESQLTALSTQRELLRARQLTAEGERLLAQVDELMTGNTQLIEGNPVRTVRELMASAPGGKPSKRASTRRVDAFLSGNVRAAQAVVAPAVIVPAQHVAEKKPAETIESIRSSKPIFEQF